MAIAVLGEAIVDLIFQNEGHYEPHLGGSPFNVAVCAARQGLRSIYLSPLSDDQFGDQFATCLSDEGVHQAIVTRSSLPTSLALIKLDDLGQPQYRLYRDSIADKDISAEQVLKTVPQDIEIFHTGSLAITPDYLPTVKLVINELKKRDVLISIDINIRDMAYSDYDEYRSGVISLLPLADIVKASDEDLVFLNPNKSARAAAEECLSSMSAGIVLFTRGADGGALLREGRAIEFSADCADTFVDAIGAGDTFYATFLSQLMKITNFKDVSDISDSRLERTLIYATTAAGINVSRSGCNPPTLEELEQRVTLLLDR